MKTTKNTLRLCTIMILLTPLVSLGQKATATNGVITFFSNTALENIQAVDKSVLSILNLETSQIAFSVSIKDFRFDQSLMEEHFNEKYLESDKFPKATFAGKITGLKLPLSERLPVTALGNLTIHGVTHEVEIPGTLERAGDKLILHSKFQVKLADYKIEIPQVLWQKLAEVIDVEVSTSYEHVNWTW